MQQLLQGGSMSTLHYKGIVWEVSSRKDGKGVFTHANCSVSFDQNMGVFQFKQGNTLILAREHRADCLLAATHCILDSYANTFTPSWEMDYGEAAQAA